MAHLAGLVGTDRREIEDREIRRESRCDPAAFRDPEQRRRFRRDALDCPFEGHHRLVADPGTEQVRAVARVAQAVDVSATVG